MQHTAYELRISDWSSDVCSSDLPQPRHRRPDAAARLAQRVADDRRLEALEPLGEADVGGHRREAGVGGQVEHEAVSDILQLADIARRVMLDQVPPHAIVERKARVPHPGRRLVKGIGEALRNISAALPQWRNAKLT